MPYQQTDHTDIDPGLLAELCHSLDRLHFAALVSDASGQLRHCNPAAQQLLQTTRAQDWSGLLPDGWQLELPAWLEAQQPVELEREYEGDFLRWEITPVDDQPLVVMLCYPLLERENYRRILEYSVDGIYQTSRAGEIIYANQSLARTFGYQTPKEMRQHIQQVARDIYRHPEDRARFVDQLKLTGEVVGFECEMFGKSGESIWVRQNARAVLNGDGQIEHIIGTVADVTALKQSELARQQAESDYERLFNTAQAGLYQSTEGGVLLRINEMFARLLGYTSPTEMRTRVQSIGDDIYADPAIRRRLLTQLAQYGRVVNERVQFRRADGHLIWVLMSAQYISRSTPADSIIEGSIFDITEQVQAENEIRFLAEHDPLTLLPNRSRFQAQLEQHSADGPDTAPFTVLFLDLDHFKDINDTLGHLVGDALLKEIGRRLRKPLDLPHETFRLGGDEFAILINRTLSDEELDQLCQRIIKRAGREYLHEDNRLKVTASLGVVHSSQMKQHAEESLPEAIMRAADLALYSCKRGGRAGYRLYEESMHLQLQHEKDLENRLEQALADDSLELHFQPIYSAHTGRIIAVEALLRWPTQEGMISPAVFIPLAERCGLIADIDAWVIQQATALCPLLTRHRRDIRVSFNLSAHHFNNDSLDLLFGPVAQALEECSHNLSIELTERVMFEHTDRVIGALEDLRMQGISISLDDFGTGYSSLSYLTRLPVDKLKIDQSFIREMDSNPTALAVVQAAAQIGRTLNLITNAEGVETAEQYAFVSNLGIDEVQGFHLGHPMPLDDILQLLEQPEVRKDAGPKGTAEEE